MIGKVNPARSDAGRILRFLINNSMNVKSVYTEYLHRQSSLRRVIQYRLWLILISCRFSTAYCLKSLGGVGGRNGLSREIQHSNKAPRHHNDNFESIKRFIETVAELRISKYFPLFLCFFLISLYSKLHLCQ